MTISTWNPSDKDAAITLTYSNSWASCSVGTPKSVRATKAKSSGKWYFEVLLSGSSTNPPDLCIGVGDNAFDLSTALTAAAQTAWAIDGNGDPYDNGSVGTPTTVTFADGDYVGVAVDFDNGYIWFFKNGALMNGDPDPPDATNYDFATITGTLYPSFSTQVAEFQGIGKWLAADLGFAAPSGFLAWDDGSILPETCESYAIASDTIGPGGSQMSITLLDGAVAQETALLTRTVTLTSSAIAVADLLMRRSVSLESLAIAQETLTHFAHSTITLESVAVVVNELKVALAATIMSTANATETLLMRRSLSLQSNAVAVDTLTTNARFTAMLQSNAVATGTLDGRKVLSLSSGANAEATLIALRRVTENLTSNAVAAETLTGNARVTMLLNSSAVASDVIATIARMKITLTSEAEAQDYLRIPDNTFPNVWLNTTSAAASIWSGLPFNSMIESDGEVYGAGIYGLYKFTPKADDNGETLPVEVLWDLSDFGSDYRKRIGHVYVAGYCEDPGFVVNVTTHQGSYSYSTRLPRHEHATNYRATLGRGLDSQFYRIGVTADGYCECKGVIVDTLVTDRRI